MGSIIHFVVEPPCSKAIRKIDSRRETMGIIVMYMLLDSLQNWSILLPSELFLDFPILGFRFPHSGIGCEAGTEPCIFEPTGTMSGAKGRKGLCGEAGSLGL